MSVFMSRITVAIVANHVQQLISAVNTQIGLANYDGFFSSHGLNGKWSVCWMNHFMLLNGQSISIKVFFNPHVYLFHVGYITFATCDFCTI